MENSFDKKYELRYFDMGKYGEASPVTMLTLLEETAAEHSHQIDHCLYSLEKQNIGWVLLSGVISMIRYPRYRENITIRTWVSKFSLVKGYRENLIYDESDSIIGMAKGVWVFYDIEKRKPVPIKDEIKSRWGINPEVSQETDPESIKIVDEGDYLFEYNVQKSDVDSNKHVNNIRYFHWLIDSLPEKITDDYRLKKINAKFHSSAYSGEKIQVCNKSSMEENMYLHSMKASHDNRLLAAAQTTWEKR